MTKIQRVEIVLSNDGDPSRVARRVQAHFHNRMTVELRASRALRLRVWLATAFVRIGAFIMPGVKIRTVPR